MSRLDRLVSARATVLAGAAALLLAACGGGDDQAALEQPQALFGEQSPTMRALAADATGVGRDIVVMLRPGVAAPAFAASYGVVLVDQFGKRPIYRLRAGSASAVAGLLSRMQTDPRVQFAERNAISETPESKWDAVWAVWDAMWAVGNGNQSYTSQWAPQAMGLASAHQLSLGDGIRVALLDTGIDLLHPDLSQRIARSAGGAVLGRDFVDNDDNPSEEGGPTDKGWGHGTHVAGLVALTAPQARLMPYRVLDRSGRGNLWVLAEALMHAVDPDGDPATDDGAHIVNISLGTTTPTRLLNTAVELATCSDDDDDEADDDYSDPGFDDDRARCNLRPGVVVMGAAGNSGTATELIFPAAERAEGQLAVTASNVAGQLTAFANRGDWIDLAAPGDKLISTMPGGGYAVWSGTSMATPLASGVAALVLAQNRDWKPVDVTKRLLDRGMSLCGSSMRLLNAQGAVWDQTPVTPSC